MNSRNARANSGTGAYATSPEAHGKQSASKMKGRATSGFDTETMQSMNAASTAYDPLGIASTGRLPEIADAFRATGNVCVERTIRIINRGRPSYEYSDELVDQIRGMGKTFTKSSRSTGKDVGYASQMASLSGTLQ